MAFEITNYISAMKKNELLLLVVSFILFGCGKSVGEEKKYTNSSKILSETPYAIDVTNLNHSAFADTIILKFKITNKRSNQKEFWGEIRPQDNEVEILNDRADIRSLRIINRQNSKGNDIPDNILVSLVIDKNISETEMMKVKEAVRYLMENCPENTVYISFFDDKIRASQLITPKTFDMLEDEFTVSVGKKIIFDAALAKFRELAGEKDALFNSEITAKAANDSIKKYMILLTDGRVDVSEPSVAENIYAFNKFVQDIDEQENGKQQIEIHAIRYGEYNTDVDSNLAFICRDIRNENVKGGFYTADPDSILNKMKEFTDKLSPDYELVLVNTPGRIYSGERRDFLLQIIKNTQMASGQKNYVIGTPANPLITGSSHVTESITLGFIWGLVILFITFFIIQVGIPYIMYSTSNFDQKYVQKYKPNEDEVVKCNFCSEEFLEDEEVVVKCQHTIHKACWIENGNKCTEYGQNCKEGKQYYFDKTRPFSSALSPFYMKWVLYGMAGGFLAWFIYQAVIFKNAFIFGSLTSGLLDIFYPGNLKDIDGDVLASYKAKIGPLLLIGPLLGFILTALFSYINEFRKKKGRVLLEIFWRSVLGAFCGFLAFLLGAIIIILSKANGISVWVDWIPWLLFGGSLGLCLSVKTTIVWKHALLGGILSGLVSFVLLFFSKWFGSYAVLLSFMLYSAGLGISIVMIHRTAQRYFLRYRGSKEGEIAIHKWMSALGGNNDVTIGRSNNCIIQMNWDNDSSIEAVHAILYINKKSKIPSLRVVANNLTFNGNVVRKNDEFLLKDGVTFRIGSTDFQYIEKT